ncbi:MAG TPA: PilZ domain-containing protein [Pyrinomonadaceae bacterium]|jgi:hypothetical protein
MPPIAEKANTQSEIGVSLPVKIEAYASENSFWREISCIESVSQSSAVFYLTRHIEVGKLMVLKMPVRKELRRYDFDKPQYRVWGIVRSCERTMDLDFPIFCVSVAFIGQEPPSSFNDNPSTIYRLGKLGVDGFWRIDETRSGPENRRHPRYPIPIEVYIAIYDAQENIVAHEKTVTENISESGASVFSQLQLKVGDSVRLINQKGGFAANAVVRSRRVGKDNLPRLHLEFVNGTYPLDGIN